MLGKKLGPCSGGEEKKYISATRSLRVVICGTSNFDANRVSEIETPYSNQK